MKFIKQGLAQSLANAFSRNSDKSALIIYEKNGTVVRKTYQELKQDCAGLITELNKTPNLGDNVAILADNSYSFVVHFLSFLFLGKEIALLHPRESNEQIQKKWTQLGAGWNCFFDPSLFLGVPNKGWMPLLKVEPSLQAEIPDYKFNPSAPRIRIFTSGSTGHSKIVLQSESSIIANVDSLLDIHQLHNRTCVIGTCLPLFHVNALEFSFLCALLTGQTLALYAEFNNKKIEKSIVDDHVDILSFYPQLVELFLKAQKRKNNTELSRLQYVVTAASSLSKSVATEWFENSKIPLIQGYGLSEGCNFSCLNDPFASFEKNRFWMTNYPRPSIGKPVRGNEVVVLDEADQNLEANQIGQIAIKGWNLMNGYEGDQAFADGTYFKTGDTGYFLLDPENGDPYFFIEGRIKDIIKRNGETISLREVDEEITKVLAPFSVSGIAVGFKHKFAGEEIGAVIQGPIADTALIAQELGNIHVLLRPKVVLITSEKISTPSGKPLRWPFVSGFHNFESVLFTQDIIIQLLSDAK